MNGIRLVVGLSVGGLLMGVGIWTMRGATHLADVSAAPHARRADQGGHALGADHGGVARAASQPDSRQMGMNPRADGGSKTIVSRWRPAGSGAQVRRIVEATKQGWGEPRRAPARRPTARAPSRA